MFGRIQTVDNKVLYNISRMHKPALTKTGKCRLCMVGDLHTVLCCTGVEKNRL